MAFANGGRVITDGLVLALDAADKNSYPGSGTTWNDVSGNGNNGTLTNGPTFSNNSIVFDGSNDYVNCGNNIQSTYTALTIENAIRISKINTKQAILSSYESISTVQLGWGLEVLSNNTINFFGFQNTSTVKDVQTISTISLNTNYTITGVFVASTYFNIYINGTLAATTPTTLTSITKHVTTSLVIAAGPTVVIPFQGSIYSTKIYNRALSAQEVLQNYNAQKSRFGL
jgi:hypothetical protein